MGYFAFYDLLFAGLRITTSAKLHNWCKKRDKEQERKKGYNSMPVNKARQAHKAEAKQKEQLYLKELRNPRTGTTSQARRRSARGRRNTATTTHLSAHGSGSYVIVEGEVNIRTRTSAIVDTTRKTKSKILSQLSKL